MKRIFLASLFFLGSFVGAQKRSQAIDLLQYDMAVLKIQKQASDNPLFFAAVGIASFICARLLVPNYNFDCDSEPSIMAFQGAVLLDLICAVHVSVPLLSMIKKHNIKRRIKRIKEQIALLEELER